MLQLSRLVNQYVMASLIKFYGITKCDLKYLSRFTNYIQTSVKIKVYLNFTAGIVSFVHVLIDQPNELHFKDILTNVKFLRKIVS